MKQYFISRRFPQYRANLHCHSTMSDGRLTPEELKDAYKKEGYAILAITDHEFPKKHTELSDPDFLLLTGYEAHIRQDPNYLPYQSEIHMNLFAKDPDNETLICYHPQYSRGIDETSLKAYRRAGREFHREYTAECINDFIRTANENGYMVTYNHPVWSMEEVERILSYEGIFSLEMDNYSSHLINGVEHEEWLYDMMLRHGMRRFCHGGDDNHNSAPLDSPKSDSFGAFTYILSEELTYPSVIRAMERGDMYSSTGPQIFEISYENGTVHVECSPVSCIRLHYGSKTPKRVLVGREETVSAADLSLDPAAPYFRVTVTDLYGRTASSRGYFADEWKRD